MLNLQCFSIKAIYEDDTGICRLWEIFTRMFGFEKLNTNERFVKIEIPLIKHSYRKLQYFIFVICRFAVDSVVCAAYVAKCAVERVSAREPKPRPLRSTAIRKTVKQVPPCPWDLIPRMEEGLLRTRKYRYGCIGAMVCKERWKLEIIKRWVFLFMSAYV